VATPGGRARPGGSRPVLQRHQSVQHSGAHRPEVVPNSANIVRRIVSQGPPATNHAGASGTSRDWSHPVYFAKASDPAYRIHLSAMANPNIEGRLIHVPAGARPAGAGDSVQRRRYRWLGVRLLAGTEAEWPRRNLHRLPRQARAVEGRRARDERPPTAGEPPPLGSPARRASSVYRR
jgi:hypothetical protein